MVELLAILAAYGTSIGLVHLFRWRRYKGRSTASHAVIVTRDVGLSVEWHLRAFAFAQWLQAKHTRITVVDEGSTDETVRIVRRLIGAMRADWEFVEAGSTGDVDRWTERADEVLVFRGPVVGCVDPAL
ncbi:hypothetical protein MO973_24635 [Paenibacillus sp. TRM 82003]|nr:hypothetical protein [Paenibacillus sp. TRM 82003]MCI3923418.1 hypothetical protein [Paenibacillus sp. TRM 82003]